MYSWRRLFQADQNNPLSQEVGSSIPEDELPDAELEDLSVDPSTIRVGNKLGSSDLPQNIKEILTQHLSALSKLESEIKSFNADKLILSALLSKELGMSEESCVSEVKSIEPASGYLSYYTGFTGWQNYFFTPPESESKEDEVSAQQRTLKKVLTFEENAIRALSFLPLIEMIFINAFRQDIIENQGEKMTAASQTLAAFQNLIVDQIERFGFDANILMPEALEIIADYVKKMPDQSNLMNLWLLLANHYAENDRLLKLLPILILRLEEGEEEANNAYKNIFTQDESISLGEIQTQVKCAQRFNGFNNYERIRNFMDRWLDADHYQIDASRHW